MSQIYYKEKL